MQDRASGTFLIGLVVMCLSAPDSAVAQITYGDAIAREVTAAIPEPAPVSADALSREVTFFVPEGPAANTDAISREMTFFVPEQLVVYADAVSREVTFFVPERLVVYTDALSRDVTFIVPEPPAVLADAVSREITFFIPLIIIPYQDAVSREVTFVIPEGPVVFGDAVTGESSFYFLGTVAVRPGYLGKELARIPHNTVRWMSLASWDHPTSGVADLFVAVATGLGGAATDPVDDFVYRVFSSGGIVSWFSLPEATADPVAIAVSPGPPWDATPNDVQLFVAVSEAPGAATGPAIMRYDARGVGSVFAAGGAQVTDPRHLRFRSGAPGGYADLLYWANGAGSPSLVSVGSGGAPAGYSAAFPGGAKGLAFAAASTFGSGLYLGGAGRTVYLTDTAGQSTALTGDLGAGVEALAFGTSHGFENYLFALLDDGQVIRINPDGQFEPFLNGIGLPASPQDERRNDLCFSSGGDQLFVSDAVRGLVYAIQNDRPSGADPDADLPPALTELKGNFPNPFNPSTTISFALSADGPVKLDIYDLAGRRIRQLLNESSMPAGQQAVVWDGRDEAGQPAATGVYLVSLRTADKTFAGKIALVK